MGRRHSGSPSFDRWSIDFDCAPARAAHQMVMMSPAALAISGFAVLADKYIDFIGSR